MEIPYRNTKLLVKTIPKGTLLFRLTKNPSNDFKGVSTPSGRCLTPNFNVFFYPNPFIGKAILSKWFTTEELYVYVLTNDVKVLYLLNPSKYSRASKNTKRSFIKRCSTVPKGCLPRKQNEYDPCFSDSLIKKYPDVVGILSISLADAVRTKHASRKLTSKVKKYFQYATDATGITGIPEMSLHPLQMRPQTDILSSETDSLKNNYKLLKKLNPSEGHKFMEKHAVYNPDTYFFNYTE